MRTCESENAGIEVNKRNKAAVDAIRRRNRMRDMGTSRGAQLIRTLLGNNRCLFQVFCRKRSRDSRKNAGPEWARRPHGEALAVYRPPRLASSASSAKSFISSKNAGDCPMNRPMSVKNLSAPIATPFVWVGRMIEHLGSLRLRNGQGSGMIRLVSNSSPPK